MPEISIYKSNPIVQIIAGANTGMSGVTSASNLGAGAGVFSAKVGNDLQFKSLVAGTNIGIASDAVSITISNTAPSFVLTNGSGTTAAGTAVNLGGALTTGATLTGAQLITFQNFVSTGSINFTQSGSLSAGASLINFAPTMTVGVATSPTAILQFGNTQTFGANNGNHYQVSFGNTIALGGFTGTTLVGIYYNPTITGSGTNTHYAALFNKGTVGIGTLTPTALLHLAAGTATAGTAPLKLTTGTALGTPENGAFEYHTSHLYFTIGSTRYQLDQQTTPAWLLASGGTLSGPNLIVGTTSNTISYRFNSLTSQVDGAGALYVNSAGAVAGTQQWSPSVTWSGQGWATTPVASQAVNFTSFVLPIQGATNPSAYWMLQSSINGAGYSSGLLVTSNGSLIVGSQAPFGFIWDGRAGNIYAGGLLTLGTAPLAGPWSGYGADIYTQGGGGIPLRILSNSGNVQLMTFYDSAANLSHNHIWLDYQGSSVNTGLATNTASQANSVSLSFRNSLWTGAVETKAYFSWRADASTSVNQSYALNLYQNIGATPTFSSPVVSISSVGGLRSISLTGSNNTTITIDGTAGITTYNAYYTHIFSRLGATGAVLLDIFDQVSSNSTDALLRVRNNVRSIFSVSGDGNINTLVGAALATTTGSQASSYINSLQTSLWNGASETKGWFSWRADASTTINLDQDLSLYASTGASPSFTLPVLRINKGGSVMSFGYGSAETLTMSFTGGVGQNFHITNGGGGYAYRFYDSTTYAGVKAGTLGTLMLTVTSSMLTAPVAARIGTYIEIAPGGANRINLFAGGGGVGLDIYNNGNSNYLFAFNDFGSGGANYGNQSKYPLSMYQNGANSTSTATQISSRDFNFVSSLWTGAAETKGWYSWKDVASTSVNLAHTLTLYTSTGTSPGFTTPIFSIDGTGAVILPVSGSSIAFSAGNGLIIANVGTLRLGSGSAGNSVQIEVPNTSVNGAIDLYMAPRTFSQTTGTGIVFQMNKTFQVASGTATFTGINLNNTWDLTGTYAGIGYGIDYNPTLTNVVGLTHIAFRATSGSVLIGGTTITNASTLLDLQSTTKGVRFPNVTNIASVTTPAKGMIAYDAATDKFNFRENTSWVQLSSGATLLTADVTLNQAQILTLNASPVQLVAAPGAGKFIQIIGPVICKYVFNSAAFATNVNLRIKHGAAVTSNVLANVIDQVANAYGNFGSVQWTGLATAVENQAVNIDVATGNPTAGGASSTLRVTFQYIIATL